MFFPSSLPTTHSYKKKSNIYRERRGFTKHFACPLIKTFRPTDLFQLNYCECHKTGFFLIGQVKCLEQPLNFYTVTFLLLRRRPTVSVHEFTMLESILAGKLTPSQLHVSVDSKTADRFVRFLINLKSTHFCG